MRFRKLLPSRRGLLRLGIALALGVGCWLGLLNSLNWRFQKEWAAVCAEADRLDPGWRWDNLMVGRSKTPDGSDCVSRVYAAQKLLPARTGIRLNSGNQPNERPLDAEFRKTRPPHRFSPYVVAALRESLTSLAPALAELNSVAEFPVGHLAESGSPILQGNSPDQYAFLTITNWILYLDLVLRAEDGEYDRALERGRDIIQVARPLTECFSLQGGLIAGAIRQTAVRGIERILSQGEASSAALDATRQLLAVEASRPVLLNAFRGQRAFVEDTIRSMDEGRLGPDQVARSALLADPHDWTPWPSTNRWLGRVSGADLRRSNAVELLRHYNQIIEWSKESLDGFKVHEPELVASLQTMADGVAAQMELVPRFAADARTGEAPLCGGGVGCRAISPRLRPMADDAR
jgi:hypothetical protein